MNMNNIPFGTTDWAQVAPTEHKGETGTGTWRTQQFDAIRSARQVVLKLPEQYAHQPIFNPC